MTKLQTDSQGSVLAEWDPLIIERVDAFHVAMPLLEPYTTSFGSIATNHSVLLRIEADGDEAWSETTPLAAPEYSAEWAGSVMLCLRDWLGPAILGAEIASPAALGAILGRYRGNQFAKAALDIAAWSLASKRASVSLGAAIGGTRDRAEVGAAFGVAPSIGRLLDQISAAVDEGVRRVKLKMTTGWELDVVEAARTAFPDLTIHVDCNGHYTLDDVDLFRDLDRFELAMIEQPLAHDDLVDHAQLQREIRTPICLDESATTASNVRKAIALGSCRIVNIKPGRVGGLTSAIEIDDLCREAGIPCWVGGMLESQLGEAICTALATRSNMTYPADIFPAVRFYDVDLCDPPVRFERATNHGVYALEDDVPGLPQRPDATRLATWTVERFTLCR